jgi:hypothetical protein
MKRKLVIVAVVVLVFFALGFRVAHPQAGLESALGSAKSSLVIYRGANTFEVGQKVVVVVSGSGNQLGIVKAASKEDGTVDVDTTGAFVRVKNEDVVGRMMIVIPFFGTLASIVGL